LNYYFSNPIRVNELFRPVLKILLNELSQSEEILTKLKEMITSFHRNKLNLGISASIDIEKQIEAVYDESIEFLLRNEIISKTYPDIDIFLDQNYIDLGINESYSLTNKAKRHIQSEEPIRFINSEGVVTFVLDFLP
jgi:neutral trehalase